MKIKNKYDGSVIESSSIKEEVHLYRMTNLANCNIFFKHDGWEEVGNETDFVTKWHKIERGARNFTTGKCLDEMFANIPIAVKSRDDDYYAIGETDELDLWLVDLKIHPFYTHWMKLPKFKEE